MARYESAARRYDSAMPARPRREAEPRRDFEVVEGRGLDARVRGEVLGAPEFVRLAEALLRLKNEYSS